MFRFIQSILVSGFIFLQLGSAISQSTDFIPLRCQGEVPDLFKQYAQVKARLSQQKINKSNLSKKEKRILNEYNTGNIFLLDQLLSSGRITYGDELTSYLEKLLDVILNGSPEIRKNINIFTLRSPEPNAFATGHGYIFVTTGLMARIKNEAQLAFILCHEIQHYLLKHSLESLKYNKKMSERVASRGEKFESAIKKIYKFSRKNEFEADSAGLELFLKTPYSAYVSMEALGDLDTAMETPFLKSSRINKNWLETETYKFESILEKKIKNVLKNNTNNNEEEEEEEEDDDEEGLTKKDFSTHPEIQDRINAILGILKEREKHKIKDSVFYIIGNEEFLKIQKMARFEVVYENYIYGNYAQAYYYSAAIEEKYGASNFLSHIQHMSLMNTFRYVYAGENEDEIGFDATDKLGTWKEFFALPSSLSKKEMLSALLHKLYILKKNNKGIKFESNFQVALKYYLEKNYINKGSIKKITDLRADSILLNNKSVFYFLLGDVTKEEAVIAAMNKKSSSQVDGEEEDEENNKNQNKKNKVSVETKVSLKDVLVLSPYFAQYREGIINNKNSLIDRADMRYRISDNFKSLQKKRNWDFDYLEIGSNPNITTDDINTFAFVQDMITEMHTNSVEEIAELDTQHVSRMFNPNAAPGKRYIALSAIVFYQYLRSLNVDVNCGVETLICLPFYLIYIMQPERRQYYSMQLIDLENGQVVNDYYNQIKGNFNDDNLKAQLYRMLNKIQYIKK